MGLIESAIRLLSIWRNPPSVQDMSLLHPIREYYYAFPILLLESTFLYCLQPLLKYDSSKKENLGFMKFNNFGYFFHYLTKCLLMDKST